MKSYLHLDTAAELRPSEFNGQGRANTAWAFATVDYRDDMLFRALAFAAGRWLSELNRQNVANAAWDFSNHESGGCYSQT